MKPERHEHPVIRVATYNIHKGVQGLGPARRLEIHNLGHAVEQLDADIVCLQEVRREHRREGRLDDRVRAHDESREPIEGFARLRHHANRVVHPAGSESARPSQKRRGAQARVQGARGEVTAVAWAR